MSVLKEFLNSFPNNSVTIERYSETKNSIGEKIKSWTPVYSDLNCIFILRNQYWDENEIAQKQKIKAKFECRIELKDIWESKNANKIENVTEKDRAIIWWKIYKIAFVHWALWDTNLIDHCILFLDFIE